MCKLVWLIERYGFDDKWHHEKSILCTAGESIRDIRKIYPYYFCDEYRVKRIEENMELIEN